MQNDKFRKDANGSFSFNNRNKTSNKWIVFFMIIIIILCGVIIILALSVNKNSSNSESSLIYESKTSELNNDVSFNSDKVSNETSYFENLST